MCHINHQTFTTMQNKQHLTPSFSPSRRPLIKLSITWRKNGVLVTSGLSDFNRRLTILSPVVSDAGFYECEAILRSSSVPSVSAGAYLHVLGKNHNPNSALGCWADIPHVLNSLRDCGSVFFMRLTTRTCSDLPIYLLWLLACFKLLPFSRRSTYVSLCCWYIEYDCAAK